MIFLIIKIIQHSKVSQMILFKKVEFMQLKVQWALEKHNY